jgi:hypothetical protein
MSPAMTRILKKNRVKPAAPRRIGAAPGMRRTSAPAAGGETEVRVVERHADRVVLEVRCPCGNVTHVECRWQDPAPTGLPDGRQPAPAAGRSGSGGPEPPARKANP